MVTLYQLDQDIRALTDRIAQECDQETGAIPVDLWEQMDALLARQSSKLVDVACVMKERRAEAKAIRDEMRKLADRAKAIEGQADRLESLLEERVGAEGISDPRVQARWRKSLAVEVSVPAETLPELCRRVKYEPDKIALGRALKAGAQIDGVALVERQNLVVS